MYSRCMLLLETRVIFQPFIFDLMSLNILDESPTSFGALIVSKQETLSYNIWTSTQAMDNLFSLPILIFCFICQKLIFGSLA